MSADQDRWLREMKPQVYSKISGGRNSQTYALLVSGELWLAYSRLFEGTFDNSIQLYEDKIKEIHSLRLSANFCSELNERMSELYISIVYHSEAIEGGTLSMQQVEDVFYQHSDPNASEHRASKLECAGHVELMKFVRDTRKNDPPQLSSEFLLTMNRVLLGKVDSNRSGNFRRYNVTIKNELVLFPEFAEVPALIEKFVQWFNSFHDQMIEIREELIFNTINGEMSSFAVIWPILFAAEAHFKLLSIHPFFDGNGRISRSLANMVLEWFAYPPLLIRVDDRQKYFKAVHTGQASSDHSAIAEFFVESMINTYKHILRLE